MCPLSLTLRLSTPILKQERTTSYLQYQARLRSRHPLSMCLLSMIWKTNSFKTTTTKYLCVTRQIFKRETRTLIQQLVRGRSSEKAQRLLQLIETLLKLVMKSNMCEVVRVNVHSPAKAEISRSKTGKGRIRLKLQELKIPLPLRTIILVNGKSQLREH